LSRATGTCPDFSGASSVVAKLKNNVRDTSNVAFVRLLEQLNKWDFRLIDARQEKEDMRSLGGELIAIDKFPGILNNVKKSPTISGKWC